MSPKSNQDGVATQRPGISKSQQMTHTTQHATRPMHVAYMQKRKGSYAASGNAEKNGRLSRPCTCPGNGPEIYELGQSGMVSYMINRN